MKSGPCCSRPTVVVVALTVCSVLLAFGLLMGCSRDEATRTAVTGPGGKPATPEAASPVLRQDGSTPPAGVVQVAFGGETLDLWPYTGASFDGVSVDPVNLIFVGKADPVRIRAALLGLGGDRTPVFPPVYPFNARWSDAIGDVQTNYAGDEGWLGSVIQLQIGIYEPVRVHLRLFRTGKAFGDGGVWTVGAAHFEVLIPGTINHESLSWELARDMVTYDFMRSGLIDPSFPVPVGPITQTPTYRTIRKEIYNGLPEELKAAIHGPPGLVDAPVPIPNDGVAYVFHLVGEAPAQAGPTEDHYALAFNQIIPKPVCVEGPNDNVLITGPVDLARTTAVDASGVYEYHERMSGHLTVTPVDATGAPAGASYNAVIGDLQQGSIDLGASWALAELKEIAPQKGGSEMLMTRLRVGTTGKDAFTAQEQCP